MTRSSTDAAITNIRATICYWELIEAESTSMLLLLVTKKYPPVVSGLGADSCEGRGM